MKSSRNTIPVPVRSKQRVSSTFDPQPKKRQKTSNPPDTPVSRENDTSAPAPLPISSNARINALNSDDSDGDGRIKQLPQFMNLILIRLLVMSPRPILPFLLVLPPSR